MSHCYVIFNTAAVTTRQPSFAFNHDAEIMSTAMDVDPPENSADTNAERGIVTTKDGKKRFEVKKVSQRIQAPSSR